MSPKSSDACIPSKMSDRPSGPKWETDRCKEEADGGEGAGPSRARDDPAPARDRALIPKGGLKLGSGKLRLLQEIARADEANWQNLQESLAKAEEDGSTKQDLIDDLSRLTAQRKEAAEGIQQSLETEIQRIKDAEDEDKSYLEALDAQGSYMREVERRNLVRLSKAPLKSSSLPGSRLKQASAFGWLGAGRKADRGHVCTVRELREAKLIPPLNLSSPLRQQQPHERKPRERKFKTSEPHCCRPMANQGNFEEPQTRKDERKRRD